MASLSVFALALLVLHRALAHVRWLDIKKDLAALSSLRLVAAAGFTAASYFWLSWYDTLAVRFVSGKKWRWRCIAPTSFAAYAIGHNLGVSTLSGGAIRLREYSLLGLSTAEIAGVVVLCIVGLGLGANLLLDYAFFGHSAEAALVLHLSVDSVRGLGVINVGLLLAYLAFTGWRRGRPLALGSHQFLPPSTALSLRQALVSVADLACSAAAFYCLFPVDGLGFLPFLGFYVLAMVAGLASNVPGGLGVFESVLMLTVPQALPAQLAGAALAFRAIYYLAPFALALLLLAGKELRRWLLAPDPVSPGDCPPAPARQAP